MLHPLVVLSLLTFASAAAAPVNTNDLLRCIDNDGKPVDWWVMYKTPDGYQFSYADPGVPATAPLTIFDRQMDDEDNPVAITRTLQRIAEHPPQDMATPSYFLYNDEPDDGVAPSSYGHTKGVVATSLDYQSGLWIVHSTPHWPASTGKAKFYFPQSEIIFGQTFLCVSLGHDELEAVGKQLLLTRPYVYHRSNFFARANSTVSAEFPNLAKVLTGDWVTDPATSVVDFTAGPTTFQSLAKNKEWKDDLWESLVAAHYQHGLVVESWIRGQELGPYCPPDKPYVVVDAETLWAKAPSGANVTWTATQDHAKWAVALHATTSGCNVCIGDINRMESQRNRGGGAVCWSNQPLCDAMSMTITSRSHCSTRGIRSSSSVPSSSSRQTAVGIAAAAAGEGAAAS